MIFILSMNIFEMKMLIVHVMTQWPRQTVLVESAGVWPRRSSLGPFCFVLPSVSYRVLSVTTLSTSSVGRPGKYVDRLYV